MAWKMQMILISSTIWMMSSHHMISYPSWTPDIYSLFEIILYIHHKIVCFYHFNLVLISQVIPHTLSLLDCLFGSCIASFTVYYIYSDRFYVFAHFLLIMLYIKFMLRKFNTVLLIVMTLYFLDLYNCHYRCTLCNVIIIIILIIRTQCKFDTIILLWYFNNNYYTHCSIYILKRMKKHF